MDRMSFKYKGIRGAIYLHNGVLTHVYWAMLTFSDRSDLEPKGGLKRAIAARIEKFKNEKYLGAGLYG